MAETIEIEPILIGAFLGGDYTGRFTAEIRNAKVVITSHGVIKLEAGGKIALENGSGNIALEG